MNNVSKLNTRIEELLTPSQIVAFHLDNFFTIPKTTNNVLISEKIDFNTNSKTLKLLVENLINTYGKDCYVDVVCARPELVDNIRKVYKNA